MRQLAAGVLVMAGLLGVTASLMMVRKPLPDVPTVSRDRVSMRDGPEVASARAKLYEAEVKQYAELVERDRESERTRPEYERWWVVYLVGSALLALLGLCLVK